MIRIRCDRANAYLQETETLTAGMVNLPTVQFTFSDEWNGYGKTAVVRAGNVRVEVLLIEDAITVPAECLEVAGVNLIIGVYGADSTHELPTVWCACGEILDGTDINSAINHAEATSSNVDQMLEYAASIEAYAEELDENVIREAEAVDTNANQYGVAHVNVTDDHDPDSRKLTFTFTNLKGNGIKSLTIVDDETDPDYGKLQIRESNEKVTNFSGMKDAIDSMNELEGSVESAEASRVIAETVRTTAESIRVTNESDRNRAEGVREQNEAARAAAEEDRVELFDHVSEMTADAETLAAGSYATATKQVDSSGNINFHFGIPKGDKGTKGDKGNKGDKGDKGDTGAVPDFSIGTVTTGAAGTDASATITGTDEAPVLNLTIPRGNTGEISEAQFNPVKNAVSKNGTYIIAPGTGDSSAILNSISGTNANTASGNYSYAEGFHTSATGTNSHAEGDRSTASGESSHAEGTSTTASGRISHAEGLGTIANHVAQRASGAYNVADPSTAAATAKGNYIEIIGNGTSNSNRSNARTLDWEGNEVLAGDLTVGGGSITVGQTTFTENQLSAVNEVEDLKTAIIQQQNVVGESGVTEDYSFSRPTGDTGTYWSNEITVPIKDGDFFSVTINSYTGSKFSRFRLFGLLDNVATELGNTTVIGGTVSVVSESEYTKLRLMIVQSTLEAPVTATFTYNKPLTGLQKTVADNYAELIEAEEQLFNVNVNKDYNLIPSNMVWTEHSYIENGSGNVVTVTDTLSEYYPLLSSDYIEIDATQGYICNYITMPYEIYDEQNDTHITQTISPFNRFMFAFFNDEKTFVATTSANGATSKIIPTTAKYIKVTITSSDYTDFARLIYGNYVDRPNLRPLHYKETHSKTYYNANSGFENLKMVLFGDSITAGPSSGFCIADYANDILGSNIISVGFGGTRMTYNLTGRGLFCFYNLCQCIVSDSATAWDDLQAYITSLPDSDTTKAPYQRNLNKLKEMDWDSVNAIGVLYGANDYSSNTPVGSAFNTTTTNYDGACAYGIQLLLQKYPHLQVLLFKPFFGLNTMGDYDTGMDVVANTAGLYIQDYGDALVNVQDGLHVPVVDTMQELSINKFTLKYYSDDGLHPRTQQALYRLGNRWANIIKRYISPY